MVSKTLPKFEGKPLIKVPETIPRVDFLEGDFGKAVNEEVQEKYGKFRAISKIGNKGSDPFYCVAVNEIFRQQGLNLRTATQADLEKILKAEVLPLENFYVDTGLVLRSEDKPNEYLARNLMSQLRERQKEMPVMIPLYGLDLEQDSNSPHGLSFKLRENSEIIHAPVLNGGGGDYSSKEVDEKTGLPEGTYDKLKNSDRHLWTRDAGLSRAYLGYAGRLVSYLSGLADSLDDGSVVVVDAEGIAPKFLAEDYRQEVEQATRAKIEKAEKVRDKALSELEKL